MRAVIIHELTVVGANDAALAAASIAAATPRRRRRRLAAWRATWHRRRDGQSIDGTGARTGWTSGRPR